jgi:hypothetical protein
MIFNLFINLTRPSLMQSKCSQITGRVGNEGYGAFGLTPFVLKLYGNCIVGIGAKMVKK